MSVSIVIRWSPTEKLNGLLGVTESQHEEQNSGPWGNCNLAGKVISLCAQLGLSQPFNFSHRVQWKVQSCLLSMKNIRVAQEKLQGWGPQSGSLEQ